MKFSEALLLIPAGILGGILSTVASIASLVTYPALLALGGAAGAAVLLLTPASTFTVVVPVLIGGASLVLLVQPRIKRLAPSAEGDNDGGNKVVHGVALLAVAMYVGYFGAAAGVMLLVVLSMMID